MGLLRKRSTPRAAWTSCPQISVVFLPAFRYGGGGGVARTNQITEDIAASFSPVRTVWISYTKVDHLKSVVFLPAVLYRLRKYKLTMFGWLRACSVYRILRNLLKCRDNHIFLIEGFLDALLLAGLLVKESHGHYITFPQNVESMVPASASGSFRSLEGRFCAEVSLYRGAVQNIAISELDAAIIRMFSANAQDYPFYPMKEKLRILRLVKASRFHVSSSEVLVIGSASNPPVGKAMESFLRKVSAQGLGRLRVIVTGFGTDVFAGLESTTISILGSISDEKLCQLLERVRCVLIPVVQSTGFLTKLVDMNLAGVPVALIGHYLQASNLQDYGIYLVETIDEFLEVVNKMEAPRKEFERPRLRDVIMDNQTVDMSGLLATR